MASSKDVLVSLTDANNEEVKMVDVRKMFEHINVAILASDANFKVIYQNEKCRQLFEEGFDRADYIGADLNECHIESSLE